MIGDKNMAKNIFDLKRELRQLRYENDFLQMIDCSKEDCKKYQQMLKNGEKLPEGVFQYTSQELGETNSFYTIYETDLTEEEKSEYILLRQNLMFNDIRTIKNCVLFFTILAVISLVLGFIVAAFK